MVVAMAATVAMIAAMAGPASARPSAGTAAIPATYPVGHALPGHSRTAATRGARAASTLVPVNVTGDITWTADWTYPNTTGGDNQTGTFHVGMTNVNGSSPASSTTYSITDNLNTTSGDSSCTTTTTASYTGGGSLPLSSAASPFFEFQLGTGGAQLNIQIEYNDTETETMTGSDPGCNGTNTFTSGNWAIPTCGYVSGSPVGMGGTFQGTYPNGTVNIGCSGSQPGNTVSLTYNITGTLTVTPACGSAAAPSRTQLPIEASSCGLSITSPPDNSTIAATDGNYLQPQPGPNDRQPEERNLAVQGSAPSSDSSVTLTTSITPGSQQVPVNGGTWSAAVPVTSTSLGQVTLTVSDANFTVNETITLIDLEITSPTEGTSLPITAQPAMPELNATVSALGYSGDTSNVSFDWTLDMRGQYIDRSGWHSYPDTPITGGETGTQTPWNLPQSSPIVGGIGRLSVSASLPGVLDGPVQSEPRWTSIPGTNPAPAAVNSEVASLDATDAGTIEHIFCHESGGHGVSYPQFKPTANKTETAFPDIPADWTPNPPVMQPKFGAPPAGIGIAQDDPAKFPDQQWNWIDNVTRGVQVYQAGLAAAQQLRQNEQARLDSERKAALKVVNDYLTAHHLPTITVPRQIVPLEPAPYSGLDGVTADAITRYNTGAGKSLFYFDYHYLASADNQHVLTQGNDQWVTQDGHWQSLTQWQAAGGIYVARRWIANPKWDPTYPTKVEGCTPPQ
jgi:hypothetical protein